MNIGILKWANKLVFDNHIGTFKESDRLWNLLESLYSTDKTFYVMRFKNNQCIDMMKYNNRNVYFKSK